MVLVRCNKSAIENVEKMAVDEQLSSVFVSIRSSLVRAVSGIVPPKEIEDIVQETYVRVCQTESKNQITSPRSFMFKTARNIALNYVNRAESRLVQSYDDTQYLDEASSLAMSSDTLDKVCSDEEFGQFCDAVRQLPLQCRRVFVLKKVYGHTQREIGAILSISEKTVEKHITKGVKRCREHMLRQQNRSHKVNTIGQGQTRVTDDAPGDRA